MKPQAKENLRPMLWQTAALIGLTVVLLFLMP
jgi:hypothetical protein